MVLLGTAAQIEPRHRAAISAATGGKKLAASTMNVPLAAVRRLAYEAADTGLLSPELVAGIRRVKGIPQLGRRAGNWLSPALAPHNLRRTCARLCHAAGGELEQIQFLLGHARVRLDRRTIHRVQAGSGPGGKRSTPLCGQAGLTRRSSRHYREGVSRQPSGSDRETRRLGIPEQVEMTSRKHSGDTDVYRSCVNSSFSVPQID